MEISAGKAGIHGQFGTLLRCPGRVELRRHRLVLNLGILLLELGVGALRRKRLNIGETFRVVLNLGGQPGNIRRRMFVIDINIWVCWRAAASGACSCATLYWYGAGSI
jgi:hypothetical protein